MTINSIKPYVVVVVVSEVVVVVSEAVVVVVSLTKRMAYLYIHIHTYTGNSMGRNGIRKQY